MQIASFKEQRDGKVEAFVGDGKAIAKPSTSKSLKAMEENVTIGMGGRDNLSSLT
jgi:hypothetical protein